MNPLTLNFWLCYCTKKWDDFVESLDEPEFGGIITANFFKENEVFFRQDTDISFKKFREISTFIDTAILDHETLLYNPRTLIPAFMYLHIGLSIGVFILEDVCTKFKHTSFYVFPDKLGFQQFFQRFLQATLNLQMTDLLPAVQFCAEFFSIPIKYDIPKAVQKMRSDKMVVDKEKLIEIETS